MFTVKSDYTTNNTKRPRLGLLFPNTARQVETPHYAIGTQRGSVPHLTPDMVETQPQLKSLQVSFGEVYNFLPAIQPYADATNNQKDPYHSMLCMRPDQSIIVSLRNPTTDLMYTAGRYMATPEQTGVENQFPYPVSTKVVASRSENGAVRVSPHEFLNKAATLRPQMLLLTGEDSGLIDSASRAEKTQRRNLEFVDQCLIHLPTLYNFDDSKKDDAAMQDTSTTAPERPLVVVPIEGGGFLDKRQRYGGYMSRKGTDLWVEPIEPKKEDYEDDAKYQEAVKNYKHKVLNEGATVPIAPDGFHLGGLGTVMDREKRCKMVTSSLDYMEHNEKTIRKQPWSRFRMTTAPGEPAELIDLLYNGIDYISSTYAACLTDEGLAMNIPITLQALRDAVGVEGFAELSEQDKLHKFNIMNLRDELYTEDPLPLDPSCGCYACKHHSRSYINHLLNTQEMLAEVLLTLHNNHQYGLFFEHFRSLVALDHVTMNSPVAEGEEQQKSPLNEWYELAQQVYVPHVHLLHRNVRRRYIHQNAANNPPPAAVAVDAAEKAALDEAVATTGAAVIVEEKKEEMA